MSLSEVRYNASTYRMMEMTRRRFGEINRDPKLAEADKKRLKEFYLENFVAPRARKLLQKHFPEDFVPTASTSTQDDARRRRR